MAQLCVQLLPASSLHPEPLALLVDALSRLHRQEAIQLSEVLTVLIRTLIDSMADDQHVDHHSMAFDR
jgi:hypothetical protein